MTTSKERAQAWCKRWYPEHHAGTEWVYVCINQAKVEEMLSAYESEVRERCARIADREATQWDAEGRRTACKCVAAAIRQEGA